MPISFLDNPGQKQKLRKPHQLEATLKQCSPPLFIFMMVCMALTAITEFGPQQWVGLILSKSGAQPMLILALVTGLNGGCKVFWGCCCEKI